MKETLEARYFINEENVSEPCAIEVPSNLDIDTLGYIALGMLMYMQFCPPIHDSERIECEIITGDRKGLKWDPLEGCVY